MRNAAEHIGLAGREQAVGLLPGGDGCGNSGSHFVRVVARYHGKNSLADQVAPYPMSATFKATKHYRRQSKYGCWVQTVNLNDLSQASAASAYVLQQYATFEMQSASGERRPCKIQNRAIRTTVWLLRFGSKRDERGKCGRSAILEIAKAT